MTIRITVPFDPSLLSNNQRLHWAERQRRTRAVRDTARLCWLQAGSPQAAGPVRVSLIVRRGRKMDADNLLTGCKGAADALFKQAVTPDDGPRWLSWGEVEQETGKQYALKPEVIFIIEEQR